MWAPLILLATAALATSAPVAPSAPDTSAAPLNVLLLPLRATGSITVKQAVGVSFRLRSALEEAGFAKLLSESNADTHQAEVCAQTPDTQTACLLALADVRGADVVVSGTVTPASDGLLVRIVAVGPGGVDAAGDSTLHGDDLDARAMERLVREVVRPSTLRGAIFVEGEAGARVSIDGKSVGTLPLKQQVNGLLQGAHDVVVRKGNAKWQRTVQVTHAQTTLLRAPLTDAVPEAEREGAASVLPLALVVTAGALALAAAAGAGLTVWATLDTQARAKDQQLVFPRDDGLLWRGRIFAATTDALLVAAVGAAGAGAALWLVSSSPNADSAGADTPAQDDQELP